MHPYSFARIPRANIDRSSFDMSYTYKTTFDAGKLIPCYVQEVLPGDTWTCQVNAFCRMTSPLQVPIFDNMYLDFQFFFVPSRLVWKNFVKMMGERENPEDSIDFSIPQITLTGSGAAVGGLYDYFGIPTGVSGIKCSALPFRAYWLIWNTWYRDENLQKSMPLELGDIGRIVPTGTDASFAYWSPAPRGKRKDYFTSALPWPQKGPGVELPLGSTAPVIGNGMTLGLVGAGLQAAGLAYNPNNSIALDAMQSYFGAPAGTTGTPSGSLNGVMQSVGVTKDPDSSGLVADLSNATAATINSLRMAFAMQHMFEVDARGGTRYIEQLFSHFGVVSPDSRLQIPEYLGGFSQPMIVNPVAQTSSTDGTSPQANLSAYAVASASENGFNKSFVEHGYLIGMCSVRADLTYAQGMNRMWSRRTREEFYFPALAHLGEQAIYNKEIYAQGTAEDDEVFGYQERWAEYRYCPNMVTGLMRPQVPNNLSVWNLTQHFGSKPALNEEFIIENPPMDRVSAVPSEPDFMIDIWFKQNAVRPLPVYSVPAHLGGF